MPSAQLDLYEKLHDSMKIETHSDLSDNPQTAEGVRPVITVNGDQAVLAVMLLLLLLFLL